MFTVINLMRIFFYVILGLLFFSGLGWLITGPFLHGSLITSTRKIPFQQEAALTITCGIIINYAIMLLLQSLQISLWIECILALIGICCYFYYIYHHHIPQLFDPAVINRIAGASIISMFFLSSILGEPITGWDARSIWFFHAKMMYVAGTLGQAANWTHPSAFFAHIDYPNLVPIMSAQVAHILNFWNEYIPKLSLFFMLYPALIWIFTFAKRSFSFLMLLFVIPFSFHFWLTNGYMDGFLALYFSLSLILLGRYIHSFLPIDLYSSICCAFILSFLKNEGIFALISILLTIFVFNLPSINKMAKKITLQGISSDLLKIVNKQKKYLLAILVLLSPLLLWSIYCIVWNFKNDLNIGSAQSITNIQQRLANGEYKMILEKVYNIIYGSVQLLGFLFFTALVKKRGIVKSSLPAIMAASVYCVGMIIIYLLTPHDLAWHLSTSVNRTMLPINGGLFVACYFILNDIETHNCEE